MVDVSAITLQVVCIAAVFALMKVKDQGKEEIGREETDKGTDLDEDTGKGKGISGISNNSSETE